MRSLFLAAACGAVLFSQIAEAQIVEAKNPPLKEKPNLIVILTDDQTVEAITGKDSFGRPFMPNVAKKLNKARAFTNTYFAESLCWPSRATLFTGMYPHNHGINDQVPGGRYYDLYMNSGLDKKSWPAQMQSAGYYTGQFGKFMNGLNTNSYRDLGEPDGWDYFFAAAGSRGGSMFDWNSVKNGKIVRYSKKKDGEAGYMTNVLLDAMLAAMQRQQHGYKKPFAFILSSTSPHLPAEASAQFRGLYAKEPFQPRLKPNFNEVDATDKPTWLQHKKRMTPADVHTMTQEWRATLESARSVDRAFKLIWDQLESSGQLSNTYIMFASDNGFIWGEHRLSHKVYPYEESVKSITYVWGPGIKPGRDGSLVSNIDWFGTFTEIAGKTTVPEWLDGRSMSPLLRGEKTPWRKTFLVRGYPPVPDATRSNGNNFRSLVSKHWKFIRYDNGETEFYDLKLDPDEMTNIASGLSPEFTALLNERVDALYSCSGQACRDIENLPEPVR